ncbi:MAG TPA: polysaccharide biosynthesis tyrosine autokinase [Bryobacterales bacterium]|nr:polysaccharide biosynthesis tyrosine autokinase [Bryobacterales bacterium]
MRLPAPDERPARQLAAPADALSGPPAIPGWILPYDASQNRGPESDEAAIPLAHHLWVLKRHRWRIAGFVLACVAATLIISERITPIYESIATVDIDRQVPTGIVGQDALRSPLNDADQFLATQVRLIGSDSVLRPVVQKYHLADFDERPEEGRPTPRGDGVDATDAPVLLKGLKVTRPPNTYLILIGYRSPQPRLAAEVANGIAQSYIQHTYNIRYHASASLAVFMEKQMEELKAKMEQSSGALAQFERELNLINPEEKTDILSARLLQLNTEYTKAQADRVSKEAAFHSVQGGTLEAAQVSTQGEALRRISERLNEAQGRFAQVKGEYGAHHPEYKKALTELNQVRQQLEQAQQNIAARVKVEYKEALSRESMLQAAVADCKAQFDRLNTRSFQYQQLKREAEADKKLYEELVHKIKEAGINASFQNSSIRLADPARPAAHPVFPNKTLNVVLAFLFSTLLAAGAALFSDSLDRTIRDPEQVTRMLKMEVVGSLPVVKPWIHGSSRVEGEGNRSGALVRSRRSADDATLGFEEAIRTLRDSIRLSNLDHRVGSLMVTSAAPREGKTTTSVYLALAHASQKRKTLLIDGDLRRPGVHLCLGMGNERGVSNILNGEVAWRDALVTPESCPDLEVLPAGAPSRRTADRLGAGLIPILEEASSQYDLVIVDSPPLLGFAEPLQIAALVDGVVIVAMAGQTQYKAVASAVGALNRLRANIIGVVLNAVHEGLSDRYCYYGYYGKYYHKYYKPDANS